MLDLLTAYQAMRTAQRAYFSLLNNPARTAQQEEKARSTKTAKEKAFCDTYKAGGFDHAHEVVRAMHTTRVMQTSVSDANRRQYTDKTSIQNLLYQQGITDALVEQEIKALASSQQKLF